ncbi:MAG TPA: hypothetical protein VMJ30_03615 [Gemmatimonadales bacterium]|nr:hypothetical protein [Gemmatimonadales bacterium]
MKIFLHLRGFALAAALVTAALVFLLDVQSPLGLTVTVLYVVPVLLSLMADRPALTRGIALLCGVLVVVGYFFSPRIGVPLWISWTDRGLVLLVVAVVAWLGQEIGLAKRRIGELEKWLTICAWTKQVNVDGQWISIERYLTDHAGLTLTHGMSKEALDRFLGEVGREVR